MCNVLVNIVFNQISPIAFANIGWKYYAVFITTNACGALTVFSFFPETKGKTLEEINALFGEEVVVESLDASAAKLAVEQEEYVSVRSAGKA